MASDARSDLTADGAPRGQQVLSPIQTWLEQLHGRFAGVHEGAVASYIPELSKASPDWFGICIATTDGHIYEVGDTRQPFSIQSISKPLTYGLALEDHGETHVLAHIGVEPTGDAFNSISLAPDTGHPLNPMINAGAIAAASLVRGATPDEQLMHVLEAFSRYTGRALQVNDAVFRSESATGHRNRAIGHMLRYFNVVTGDPEPALQLYFRQCAIEIDCRDLSLIAATLANGGVNPVTRVRALGDEYIDNVLSVMTTCGMYDFSGEWMYRIGMPAKSGVGGGVMAVLPGQLGIAVFSPPLDARGNSVRGVAVCAELSRRFNMHSLRAVHKSLSPIRAQYTVAVMSSKRQRNDAERAVLAIEGTRARIYELQGDLNFAGLEAVARALVQASNVQASNVQASNVQVSDVDPGDVQASSVRAAHVQSIAVLDLKRVNSIEASSHFLFAGLLSALRSCQRELVFANVSEHAALFAALADHAGNAASDQGSPPRCFADVDAALEWCEDTLLTAAGLAPDYAQQLPLGAHDACRGLSDAQLAHLQRMLLLRRYAAGQRIIQRGDDAAAEVFFLTRGAVSITLEQVGGDIQRLATVGAGALFGEMALVDDMARSANADADTEVECYVLTLTDFQSLSGEHGDIKTTLLQNMLRALAHTVRRLSDEVATLS